MQLHSSSSDAPTASPQGTHGGSVALGSEYLAFGLGGQEYATDILDVQEIRNFERPTRMVGAAGYVLGVLNLRGCIVPVLDLRARLGLPADFDHRTATVLLNLPQGTVGLVVDSVSDVVALTPQMIQAMPSSANDHPDSGLFVGLATVPHGAAQRTLVLLDFDMLLPIRMDGPAGSARAEQRA